MAGLLGPVFVAAPLACDDAWRAVAEREPAPKELSLDIDDAAVAHGELTQVEAELILRRQEVLLGGVLAVQDSHLVFGLLEQHGDDRVARVEVLLAGSCGLRGRKGASVAEGQDDVARRMNVPHAGHIRQLISVACVINARAVADIDHAASLGASAVAECI